MCRQLFRGILGLATTSLFTQIAVTRLYVSRTCRLYDKQLPAADQNVNEDLNADKVARVFVQLKISQSRQTGDQTVLPLLTSRLGRQVCNNVSGAEGILLCGVAQSVLASLQRLV